MFTPTSSGPKKSVCVRCTAVRLNANRRLLTTLLLSTIVSPSVTDWARLSRPPSVVERMLPDSLYGGAKK